MLGQKNRLLDMALTPSISEIKNYNMIILFERSEYE
jgi:hypothetical protein